MEALGISVYDSEGNMRSMNDILGDLNKSMDGMTSAEKSNIIGTIFNKTDLSSVNALLANTGSTWDSLQKSITESGGAAQQMADTQLDNLQGQITILKSALEGLAIQFAEVMMPYLKKFVSWLQSLVEKLQSMSQAEKEHIVKMAAFAAAIGPVLLVVGKLTTGIGNFITTIGKIPGAISMVKGGITTLVTGFKNIGEGITLARAGFPTMASEASKLGAAIGGITTPIAAVIAIIALLVAAFATLWKTNDDFRNKIIGIWNEVTAKFKEAGQKITDALNSLGFNFKDIVDVIKTAWEGFCNLFGPMFVAAIQMIATTLSGIIDVVTGVIQIICGIIKGFKDGDWTLFLDGLKTLFDGFISLITAPFQGVFEGFKYILESFGTTWNEFWNSIKTFFEGIWNSITSFFSGIWDGLVSIVSTAWETIKNVVTVGVMLIGEVLNAAFQIITLPFRFIWENCKETIMSAWETIKTTVLNAMNYININIITPIMNVISSVFITIWTSISSFISSIWNTIQSNVSYAVNTVSSVISSVWNTIRATIQNIMNQISSVISNVWNSIKSFISGAMNAISSSISSGLNAAKSAASNILSGLKGLFTSTFEGIKSYLSGVVGWLRGIFNFSWSLPRLKLPHFNVSGKFSLNPPSVPHFSIDWYAKAMNKGMILNSPSLFGFDPSTGKFLGGGEAGSETVVGTESLCS